MIALQITQLKQFMSQLLSGEVFDNFLMSEATVSTAYTYTIGGHRNRALSPAEEWNDHSLCPAPYASCAGLEPHLFQLIKGTKTPLYFKIILQLSPENTEKLLTANPCDVAPNQIKALLLTIKYDGTKAILTTGTSFTTFLMSKEPDEIWDKAVTQFLSKKNVSFENMV